MALVNNTISVVIIFGKPKKIGAQRHRPLFVKGEGGRGKGEG